MKKVYILDTNIPLLDPECVHKFEDNDVVFSAITIKELDKMKKRIDEVGKNARVFNKLLGEMSANSNLFKGIPLPGGGTLRIETNFHKILNEIQEVFFEIDNDDKILAVAIGLHRTYLETKATLLQKREKETEPEAISLIDKELSSLKPVVLVSRDNNMRIRARYFDIPAESYTSEQITKVDDLYRGWRVVPVRKELLSIYHKAKREKQGQEDFPFDFEGSVQFVGGLDPQPNEYFILVDKVDWEETPERLEEVTDSTKHPVLRYCKERNGLVGLVLNEKLLKKYRIFPKNIHQLMAVDMLFNGRVSQKSIIGLAGSGKTLFALLASIIMVNDLNLYDEIIITRPPVPMEYDMGFLPGNEQEKMDPYLRGFKGNLDFITTMKNKFTKTHEKERSVKPTPPFETYKIRTEAMTYMRGKTIHRQILIIDEAQNATLRAMKTALTRIGEDSIVILLGDISQIDHHLLDATNNGLTFAVELMKDEDPAGHVTLLRGERSELSKLVAEKWDKQLFS